MSTPNKKSVGYFNPDNHGTEVHMIGVGATGSRACRALAQMGYSHNTHIYDFDMVELKNLGNQEFEKDHIDEPKVLAMESIIERCDWEFASVNNDKVETLEGMRGIVILCVDKFSERKKLVDTLEDAPNVELILDPRLGITQMQMHRLNPKSLQHIKKWNKYIFPDREADPNACASEISLPMSAMMGAGKLVHDIVSFMKYKDPKDKSTTVYNWGGYEYELTNDGYSVLW